MSAPPAIDARPDVSMRALQALRGDALYCNVAGSGPTFPVAQDAAERFRRWIDGVGQMSHVGLAAYDAALEEARDDFADFVGDAGGGARIALTQSATDGLNTAVSALDLPRGSELVTTAEEHGSALLPLFLRQRHGDRVTVVRYESDDQLLSAVEERLRAGARAIVLSLVSCKTGKVLPVAAASGLAREHGALSIVDAAQAAGVIPIDVRALGPDAIAFLGHKWLHGPLATGALWLRDPSRFEPARIGWRSRSSNDLRGTFAYHPDARRFETGTVDVGAYVGLRQALAVQRTLGAVVGERVRALRAAVIAALDRSAYRVLSRESDPTGIVTVVPEAGDPLGIVTRMWTEERIVVKHLAEPEMPEAIRISFWALHSEADIARVGEALARQAKVAV